MDPSNDILVNEPVWLFPFEGMDVGDSFFIPTLKPAVMLSIVQERAKAARVRVRVFASTKDGCLGIRVWRTG
jgi:hypothetical protein